MVSRNDARLKAGGKPASFSLLGGESTVRDIEALEKQGVTVFDDVYQSVSPLGAMFFTTGISMTNRVLRSRHRWTWPL